MTVINFKDRVESRKDNSNYQDITTLDNWLNNNRDDETFHKIVFGMSESMKEIHSQGYHVASFSPKAVTLKVNNPSQIRYQQIEKMNPNKEKDVNDNNIYNFYDKKKFIQTDIFQLAYLATAVYTNCMEHLNANFLREHFDSFAVFLPERDVPYLKSVVENYKSVGEEGTMVYYSDYDIAKRQQEMNELANGTDSNITNFSSSDGMSQGRSMTKSTEAGRASVREGEKEAAFGSVYILSAIILFLSLIIPIIAIVISRT